METKSVISGSFRKKFLWTPRSWEIRIVNFEECHRCRGVFEPPFHPTFGYVLKPLVFIFNLEFPIQIVKNSFTRSGYFTDDTVDYSGDGESESDVES